MKADLQKLLREGVALMPLGTSKRAAWITKVENALSIRCADCNCIIEGNPNLARHDDDYGPVPVVGICDDCLEDRRR